MKNTMESVLVNGFTVRYQRTGSGNPLIFLHNAGNDHLIWDYQITYFKKTHEIFAIDLLGCGASDRPHVDYSLDLYTDMLKTFIETLGLSDVVLVGQCVGGATAINFTCANPEKVKALIVFNVASEKTLMDGAFGGLYTLKNHDIIRKFLIFMAPKIVLPKWYGALELKKQYGRYGEKDEAFIEHVTCLYNKHGHLRILNNLLMNFHTFRAIDDLVKPENFPPSMLVWGGDNKILRVAGGKAFGETFNPDKTVIFDHCGHLVMREIPDKVNTCIEEFIRMLPVQ